jgi:hypothetical protein
LRHSTSLPDQIGASEGARAEEGRLAVHSPYLNGGVAAAVEDLARLHGLDRYHRRTDSGRISGLYLAAAAAAKAMRDSNGGSLELGLDR